MMHLATLTDKLSWEEQESTFTTFYSLTLSESLPPKGNAKCKVPLTNNNNKMYVKQNNLKVREISLGGNTHREKEREKRADIM